MKAERAKEHDWLRQLVGEWTYEHDSPAAPGEMPKKFRGSESVRMLGDVWVICEGRGEMPDGGEARTVMTLGYDVQKQRFVGTFIGSMMTNLWIYDGALDENGRVLSLDTEGPSFTVAGASDRYVDRIEIVSADERILRSSVRQPDGTWSEFMVATYRRSGST